MMIVLCSGHNNHISEEVLNSLGGQIKKKKRKLHSMQAFSEDAFGGGVSSHICYIFS
jgi:hypothetical protein